MTRRFFLGTFLPGVLPPARALAFLKALGFRSPNGKLNIAAIGAGGRGAVDLMAAPAKTLSPLPIPIACAPLRCFENSASPQIPDFRGLFDREDKNIDAVLIATPDFLHGTQ